MPSNTYTTDNCTYTTIWNSDVVTSVTLGSHTFNRIQILKILAKNNHPVDYPYKEKDIDRIVTALCLARLDGAL